jgi:hypothetical protein
MFQFKTAVDYRDACEQFAADMIGFSADPKQLTILVFGPVKKSTYEWLQKVGLVKESTCEWLQKVVNH